MTLYGGQSNLYNFRQLKNLWTPTYRWQTLTRQYTNPMGQIKGISLWCHNTGHLCRISSDCKSALAGATANPAVRAKTPKYVNVTILCRHVLDIHFKLTLSDFYSFRWLPFGRWNSVSLYRQIFCSSFGWPWIFRADCRWQIIYGLTDLLRMPPICLILSNALLLFLADHAATDSL